MINKRYWIAVIMLMGSFPVVAGAQRLAPLDDANDVVARLLGLGNVAIYLLVALGVIFIVYNVVWYLIKQDALDGKKEAGLNIMWGIIGLAIIISLWGLVNLVVNTFNVRATTPRTNLPSSNIRGNSPSYPVNNAGNGFMTPGSAANDGAFETWSDPEPDTNPERNDYYKPTPFP